jgi:cell division protein FtsQ
VRRGTVLSLLSGLAVVAATGVYAAWFSPWLVVERISITGVADEVARDVRERVTVARGEPLVTVDSEAVARSVREIPQVRDATVRRGWPDTLVVAVTQRQPLAVVPGEQGGVEGRWAIVDVEGVVFGEADRIPGRLVRLTTPPDRSGAVAALAAFSTLPEDLKRLVVAVGTTQPESIDSITFVLRGDAVVMWGAHEFTKRKAEVLRALLPQRAIRYDVSAPDLPTVVPR